MQINDEVLMDYADGILNKEEEKLVTEAIKNDPSLLKKVEDFKESTKLLKMVHALDILEAHDPSIKTQKTIKQKKKNSWFSLSNITIPKFSPIAFASVSGCLLIAFIGGTQLTAIIGMQQMQNGVMINSSNVRAIGDWSEQKWFVASDIAVRLKANNIYISPNDSIKTNDKITIEYQVFEKLDLNISYIKKGDNENSSEKNKIFHINESIYSNTIEKVTNLRIDESGDYQFIFHIIYKKEDGTIKNKKKIVFPFVVERQ